LFSTRRYEYCFSTRRYEYCTHSFARGIGYQRNCHPGPTEDDGWVEGDDDNQGEISSQEELEEAYEGSQWEDDIGSNEIAEATDNDDENDDELVECEDGSLVETEELCEQSEALVTCSDGSSAATQAECPLVTEITCLDGSTVTEDEECPSTGPNPYCDTPEGKTATICHDRFDTDNRHICFPKYLLGLLPCHLLFLHLRQDKIQTMVEMMVMKYNSASCLEQ